MDNNESDIKSEYKAMLKKVIMLYHKGVITYAEYVFKQNETLQAALMAGVTWAELQGFQA